MKTITSLVTLALLLLCLSADAAFYQFNRWTTNLDGTLQNGSTITNFANPIQTIGAVNLSVSGPILGTVQTNTGAINALEFVGSGAKLTGITGGSGIATTNGFGTNLTLRGTGPPALTVEPGAGGSSANFLGGITTITNLIADLGTNYTSYAAGTPYTFTTSQATVSYSITTPTVVIAYPGTYSLRAVINLTFSGATYVSAQTIQVGLVKTNGGGTSFIASKNRAMTLPVLTTFTGGQTLVLEELIYNASAGDGIVIQGLLSAAPSAGSVLASDCEIIAVRLH